VVTVSAPAPSDSKWSATNLITNLDIRSGGNNRNPLISPNTTSSTIESCFKTGPAQLSVLGDKMTYTVDLGSEFFVHAILVVQDMFQGVMPSSMNDPLKFF